VSGAPTWAATKNLQSYSGVYYANHANVITNSPNGNVTVPSLTVIASSLNPDDCTTKQYGNISWDGIDISSAYVQGLFMLADQDLTTSANITVGSPPPSLSSGMFYAGDQVSFQTSANSVVGGVVAGDQCAISGSPVATSELKNATIVFDPNAFSPVTSIINTTLWLEYVG
jgi:hypothetical protein